jgi:cytochrome c biogenesis protein CcdA
MKHHLLEIAADDRTGVATAAGTVGISLSTILNLIPENIGNLGVLMGIILSITLCIVNIRAEIRKTKIENMQIKKLESEINTYKNDSD